LQLITILNFLRSEAKYLSFEYIYLITGTKPTSDVVMGSGGCSFDEHDV
jgi:hypothetical protein